MSTVLSRNFDFWYISTIVTSMGGAFCMNLVGALEED